MSSKFKNSRIRRPSTAFGHAGPFIRPASLLLTLLVSGCSQPSPVESWDAYYFQGSKVGYGMTRESQVTEHGQELTKYEGEIRLRIPRDGQISTQQVKMNWFEDKLERLVRFESRVSSGSTEIVTRGKRDADRVTITTIGTSHDETRDIPWQTEWGGFFALEKSLKKKPMKPGEKRRLRMLMQMTHTLADVELSATTFQPVPLLDESRNLLRIDVISEFSSGTDFEMVVYADKDGIIQKSVIPGANQEAYRTTRAVALSPWGTESVDLLDDLIVRIPRNQKLTIDAQQVVYQVRLASRDPSELFPDSISQIVRKTGQNEAEIIAVAVPPNNNSLKNRNVTTENDLPTDGDRNPSFLIQSDDPRIVDLASKTPNSFTDTLTLAIALESIVHQAITEIEFSQGLSSAADVVRSREGDCTEHAVLLAAACRARKIPARVAIGLVYYPPKNGFAYHMWNEAWIDDRWYPLDATRGEGGITATHIKIAHSNLSGTGAYTAFLPVIHIMGQLELAILHVKEST